MPKHGSATGHPRSVRPYPTTTLVLDERHPVPRRDRRVYLGGVQLLPVVIPRAGP